MQTPLQKFLTGTTLWVIVLLVIFVSANAQALPPWYTNLKMGQFAVGYKSICVFDTARKYDLTCGDSTVVLKNKNAGRPVLINVWYPAVKTSDTNVLKIKDYFNFPADENTAVFFEKFKAFQFENSKLYSTDENIEKEDFTGDPSSFEKTKSSIFENYISSETTVHRNARQQKGDFPVIIYHQGLGGTMDENSLLLEYLASNGYIVVSSAFQNNDAAWTLSVGDDDASYTDLNFIIDYSKQHLSKNKKLFLMGHSYGANTSISFLGQGHQNVDGIVPLDSDFGYALFSFYSSKYNPFVKDRLKFYNNIPVFCVGRSEAHFKMVDSLTMTKRFYLKIAEMVHDDFTSQGAIGRYYCMPYVKQQAHCQDVVNNYLHMCATILLFLNSYSKPGKPLDKKDVPLYNGWTFETSGPGEKLPANMPFNAAKTNCPNGPQFIDLIYTSGLGSAEAIYTHCTDSLKKAIDLVDIFEALYRDAGTDTIVNYLIWLNEIKVAGKNLRDIFFDIANNSFWTNSKRSYSTADTVYTWMTDEYPGSKYGYMGRLLAAVHTNGKDAELYSKKILEIDPGFMAKKGNSFWEDRVIDAIDFSYKKRN